MNKSKVIAFVGTKSPDRAMEFYQDQLDLELTADEPSALVFDANGTMLRVSKVDTFEPLPFTLLGWEVEDIRLEVDRLQTRGIAFECFSGFEQDDRAVAIFPDGTMVAWFRDQDDNMLSLSPSSQNDRSVR